MDSLSRFWHRLGDAEYLHLILEPLPLYGCLFGLIFLLAALGMKVPKIQTLALVVIAASALSYYPYLKQREASTPQIAILLPKNGQKTIASGLQQRKQEQWLYYVTAGCCLLTLAGRKSKFGPVLLTGSLVGGIAVILFSGMAHLRDAEVFHPNIGAEPSTAVTMPVTLGKPKAQ